MKHFLLGSLTAIVVSLLASLASAQDSEIGIKIEPIVGLETVYRDTPRPHTSTRTIYGLRLAVGQDLLALEAEYTKGSDTDTSTLPPEKVKYDDENIRLGLRSVYRLAEYVSVGARAGGQMTRSKKQETSAGIVTEKESEDINPYAGASLSLHISQFLTLTASSTAVIRDFTDLKKNDLQNTVSFSVGLR